MSNYKLIIFDFDGTICNTREAIVFCMQETFAQLSSIVLSEEEIFKAIASGTTLQENFIRLDPSMQNDYGRINAYIKTYREIYHSSAGIAKTSIYAGVKELLQEFQQNNIKMVLISNKGITAIQNALAYFQIKEYFDLILGDEPHIRKKPHPMLFTEIIAPEFKIDKSTEVLMVGDTIVDIIFAQNAKISSCFAAYGYGSLDGLEMKRPHHVINSFYELKNVV